MCAMAQNTSEYQGSPELLRTPCLRTSEKEDSPSVGIELLRRHGTGVVNRTVREHEDGPTPPPRSARLGRALSQEVRTPSMHLSGHFDPRRSEAAHEKARRPRRGDTGHRARRYSTTRPRGEMIVRCLHQKNFPDPGRGELRRITLLGTWVNKAAQASSETRSDYTRGGRRYLRLLWVLLLSVLAREVLRTVQNDHHDRSNAPPRGKQPRHSWQVRSREHFTEESRIGVEGGMQQHGQ